MREKMRKMKTWKRVMALALAGLLLLGVTACSKEQTPQEVYRAALEKQKDLTAMDMSMDATVNISSAGESVDVTMSMDTKVQNLNKDNMAMDILMNVNLMGISMEIQAYYVDGYYGDDGAEGKIFHASGRGSESGCRGQ